MKKALSIFMSILILALSLSMVSSAAAKKCECNVDHPKGKCTCCIYCSELDVHYLTSCAVNPDGTLKYANPEAPEEERYVDLCCGKCTGILPCECGCSCCTLSEEDIANRNPDQIFTDDQQKDIVDTFQKILGRFREFFDNLFDSIFEFLRLEEILGRTN